MKKTLSLFIASLIMSQTAFAGPGFFSPTDPKLPSELKDASDSVFEIRTAYFEDFEGLSDVTLIDLKKNNPQQVIDFVNSAALDQQEKEIYKIFIERCKTDGIQENCPVPKKINIGSGFITGSGNKFWTNAHVLDKALQAKAVMNEKTVKDVLSSKDTLSIFIFDKNGKMVFNGMKEEISFKAVPKETVLSGLKNSFYAEDSDYLAFELPKSLGRPLKVAKNLDNSDVNVIGYPVCTGCSTPEGMDPLEFADRYPYPNAKDCDQMVTTGVLVLPEVWGALANVGSHMMDIVDKSTFIGYTTDSQHGMSGGPVLNKKGEVVGINAGGKSIKTTKSIQRYSRGVRPADLLLEP